MRKAILFPFDIQQDNVLSYTCSMELAKQLKLPIIMFTSLPEDSSAEDMDKVYLHLLRLNGLYRSQNCNWQSQEKVEVKKMIKRGPFQKQLREFMSNSQLELILLQSQTGHS